MKKKNIWQAPPITHFETTYTRKEKKNEDIAPLRVKVEFKTSEGLRKSGASYIKIHFPISEKLTLVSRFDIDRDR